MKLAKTYKFGVKPTVREELFELPFFFELNRLELKILESPDEFVK